MSFEFSRKAKKMSGEFYIISYDSPSNKRRTKLFKLLKNYAVPVQKSVFETFLDKTAFNAMYNKIKALMNPQDDSIRVYKMSKSAQKQMSIIGFPGMLADPDHYIVDDEEADLTDEAKINSSAKLAPSAYTEEADEPLPDWL